MASSAYRLGLNITLRCMQGAAEHWVAALQVRKVRPFMPLAATAVVVLIVGSMIACNVSDAHDSPVPAVTFNDTVYMKQEPMDFVVMHFLQVNTMAQYGLQVIPAVFVLHSLGFFLGWVSSLLPNKPWVSFRVGQPCVG